jgi:hypothetical protein
MMKKIIYTNAQGWATVLTPAEGSRFALQVTLADGTTIIGDGREFVQLSSPAVAKELEDLRRPAPVDQFLRRWPVEGATAEWAESEDGWLERIKLKDVPADATDAQIVDESVIPADRTFRNAWRACPTQGCTVDMTAAAEIHKDTLRTLRAPKLAALDVEFMRALESGDTARCTAIAAEKQALRDVTKDAAITKAATPEELKAVIPEALLS